MFLDQNCQRSCKIYKLSSPIKQSQAADKINNTHVEWKSNLQEEWYWATKPNRHDMNII